jgi:hypothetical protein
MANKKLVPIKYTSRDFNSIRADLIEYTKKYYPDTYKDFNDASFGSLMIDSVSYIGDVLSFYLDYSVNESHLKTSIEFNNILKHGYKLGYKYNPFASSSGVVTIYCLVPAQSNGIGPDLRYAPIIKRGTVFSAGENTFTLLENVNMASENFSVRVARTNADTGTPTFYAIKGYGSVISGILKTQTVDIGNFKRFLKISVADANISEIVSVTDSEGNQYYEVDYLSQNIVYKEIPNNSSDSAVVPNILVPLAAPRRFILEIDNENAFLTFGASDKISIENEDMLEDPTNFVLNKYGKTYVTDESFDPRKLINSDKFGIAPSNTSLTIQYRVNTVTNVNASVGAINEVSDLSIEFKDQTKLNATSVQETRDSIIVENEDPIVGYITIPTSDELKIRILDNFAAQNRAVTERDYEVSCYSMPTKFGSIKRVKVIKDVTSFKRNLNLYVLSEDLNGKFTQASHNIKRNLKTWLEKNKMISDTIDIIDGKIVNLSIDYTIIGIPGKSKSEILSEANQAMVTFFQRIPEFGEPLMINDLLKVLKKVESVLDVKEIRVKNKTGGEYSSIPLNIDVSTNSPINNSVVKIPLNVVWEVKFPNSDIRGTIL